MDTHRTMLEDSIRVESHQSFQTDSRVYMTEVNHTAMTTAMPEVIFELIVRKTAEKFVEDNYEKLISQIDPKEVSAKVLESLLGQKVLTFIEEAAHSGRQQKKA